MIESKKTTGWEGRLIAYIRDQSGKPFRPGRLDCGLFFAGAVKAMTGADIAKPFRGKYRTIDAAQAIAQGLGHENHVEYVASLYPELGSPLFAQRGDGAVLEDIAGAPALGIVQGEMIYVMGLAGLAMAPLTVAKRAFRI